MDKYDGISYINSSSYKTYTMSNDNGILLMAILTDSDSSATNLLSDHLDRKIDELLKFNNNLIINTSDFINNIKKLLISVSEQVKNTFSVIFVQIKKDGEARFISFSLGDIEIRVLRKLEKQLDLINHYVPNNAAKLDIADKNEIQNKLDIATRNLLFNDFILISSQEIGRVFLNNNNLYQKILRDFFNKKNNNFVNFSDHLFNCLKQQYEFSDKASLINIFIKNIEREHKHEK